MGDMSEPKGQSLDERTNEPIMYQIHKTLGRAAKQKQKYIQNSTIKKKSKLNDDRIGSPINSIHKLYHEDYLSSDASIMEYFIGLN